MAQPILVNSSPYTNVTSIAYDSITNKVFFNFLNGCPSWNIPCAVTYSMSSQHNLINKHSYTDNTLAQVLASRYQVICPSYPVNNYNSGFSRQSIYHQNSIYTNFGYYFNRIDSNFLNPVPIWTYSPAANPSFKEISTFEIKGDSLFLLEKDSTSGFNYYTLMVKNKLVGTVIPYNSISQAAPNSSLGAIEGYINASAISGNTIVLGGVFTASVSGTLVARNLAAIDLASGQLFAPAVSFAAGSKIFDLKKNNGKIYIAGSFTSVNGNNRQNFAAIDQNLNLTNDTLKFAPGVFDTPANTWLDKIFFYDKYLIAKGNFGMINNQFVGFGNSYCVKAVNTQNNNLLPWNFALPGFPLMSDYTFQMIKNKLYIKNRPDLGSAFNIYCFDPVLSSPVILYPGSTLPNPSPSIALCAPGNGTVNIFVAPIRYASTYTWTYSGTNATIAPIGNGSTAQLILGINATGGTLGVSGTNDCGLSTTAATLNVIVNSKPVFTLPFSPQLILCNPDSTLLQGTTTNTNSSIQWRRILTNSFYPQPYYTKVSGSYYMIVTDTLSGCKDSASIQVNNFKTLPNAKITSHTYPGPFTPIDTVTCYQPTVNIIAASDTAGVVLSWKSISNNSVFTNPLSLIQQNNLKVIATRTINNCVDSSLIVLVGQNTLKPNIIVSNNQQAINCSYYTVTLSAQFSPANCSSAWSGPLSYTSSNPGTATNPGKYYFNVSDPENGCSNTDSAQVNYVSSFALLSSKDTTICKASQIQLHSIAIGTMAGISYSWSTGAIGNMANVNPSVSATYYVYASGGGCSGLDSVYITIPPDVRDSTIVYKDCGNNSSGGIAVFGKGGIPPYKYSINNGLSFSASNTFSNLPFGTYNIIIRDSIGCAKSTSITLNANSNLPTPKFVAGTNNFLGDTIVLVDISIPKADSVQWVIPLQANIVGGNMFNPVITLSDTGTFNFTMKAFYNSCVILTGKSIHFAPADSLHASDHNLNGIKTFSLYPNPNDGNFTAYIEFYKRQDLSVQIWNNASENLYQQNFYNALSVNIPFNLDQLLNGSYVLRAIGEYDARSRTFIISK
jgi:hypothetical protein